MNQNNISQEITTLSPAPTCEEPIPDTLRIPERQPTLEEAARATLNGVAKDLGKDELRVLARVAARLRTGRERFGPLWLAVDLRSSGPPTTLLLEEDVIAVLACAQLEPLEVG
jgi:hypothetical protein